MDNNTSLYKDKKILIFGLGINQGGLGSTKFFVKQGAKVKVTDLKNAEQLKPSLDELKQYPEIEYTLGEHKNEDIDWADLIIKNPGVKPGNAYLKYAKEKGKQVEMDMGIFLQFVKPNQVIGVTGTKGKSTTSSLIYEVLKLYFSHVILDSVQDLTAQNQMLKQVQHDTSTFPFKKVLFAGNIGKSVLDTIEHVDEKTLVVLEISSFQLEAWDQHKVSPKWAVITNILQDHLNYYPSMEEYTEAKKIIAKYQTNLDYLFLRLHDPVTTTEQFQYELAGQIDYYSENDLPTDFKLSIPGKHNLLNAAAAFSVASTFNIPEDTVLSAMTKFQGVEFRQQLIKEWGGIKIYNDTAATGPDATIAALNTFPNGIFIIGGQNANFDYQELAKIIAEKAKMVFFLEGDASEEIRMQLSAISHQLSAKIKGTFNNFGELLAEVKKVAQDGDVIVLSPGAKSFNLFQNEWDRGRKFNAAVKETFS